MAEPDLQQEGVSAADAVEVVRQTTPRDFFEQHVRPNYEEWLRDPLNERRAKNAVGDANVMAARVVYHWSDRDPSQIYWAQSERQYRDELAARECEDFALVRDVADAYKHGRLSRTSRQITRYDQTAAEGTWWDDASWDEPSWDGRLVVTLDDGTRKALTDIMQNVMAMWERVLQRMKL